MRQARLAVALVYAFTLALVALPVAPASARTATRSKHVRKGKPASRPVGRCVSLDQETTGQTLDLSLTNRCPAGLTCSFGWTVRCGAGRRASLHPGSESFWLAEGDSRTVTASASECGGESWSIGAIRWSCNRD